MQLILPAACCRTVCLRARACAAGLPRISIISAFGLYALAFYASERRTKEVGIRKVLGATSKTIVSLLTWDFVKPVIVACVLAWVAGYYAIAIYFDQFSSQVAISPLLYLVVTLGTIVVAVVTVAAQCFRAANADPIESLRYE
jgi:putative ABC transport system permease protein